VPGAATGILSGTYHVTVAHGPGSVEHYHHFLLGHLVPLIEALTTRWARQPTRTFVVRSCGPLDRLMREYADSRLVIVDRGLHRSMADGQWTDRAGSPVPEAFVTIPGLDWPETYDQRVFARVRRAVMAQEACTREDAEWSRRWGGHGPRVLLIERGVAPAFYRSEQSEVTGAARDRRSMPNHAMLFERLRREYPRCLSVQTEARGFFEQCALFASADVIVAQHGAVLANLIWARPACAVVEIVPRETATPLPGRHFFFHLTWCLGLRYRSVSQAHEHAEVDVEAVCEAVGHCVAARTGRGRIVARRLSFVLARHLRELRRALGRTARRVGGVRRNGRVP